MASLVKLFIHKRNYLKISQYLSQHILLVALMIWNMESSGRSRIYESLELDHPDLPSLLQTNDLSFITEYSFSHQTPASLV